MVHFGSADRGSEQETTIAATDIEHSRRIAPEQLSKIEWASLRQAFERRLGPLLSRQNHAGERYTELDFRLSRLELCGGLVLTRAVVVALTLAWALMLALT